LSRFDNISRRVCDVKAKFLCYDNETKIYVVEIYGKEYVYTREDFYDNFLGVYEQKNKIAREFKETSVKHTILDELNIDGLFIAWAWYIFIMVIAALFYDRIGIWILASIIFFVYRNKKLKEAGYK
jgi:hypothetical protein